MTMSRDDRPWEAPTATVDLSRFWRRHLHAQVRLYAGASQRGAMSRAYCTAVVWGITTFLHALQDCHSDAALHARAHDVPWWDRLCRTELDSPSLLGLSIRGVPISGKGLSEAALALRCFEILHATSIDPTSVFDNPPTALVAWVREA